MPVDILVPPLSQTMDSVLLVQWLKAVGDAVTKGEPLFVIETDKANLEIEAPASGILRQILAEPGSEVTVRSTIGLIAAPDEPALPISPVFPPVSATGPGGQPLPLERQNRLFASPRARRLAAQSGVPLAQIKATGPQQMIIERDVKAYLSNQAAAPLATPLARRVAQAAGLDLAAVPPEHPGERITRADVAAALAQQTVPTPDLTGFENLSGLPRTSVARIIPHPPYHRPPVGG